MEPLVLKNDFIFLFGGRGLEGYLNDMWRYDVINNEWLKMVLENTDKTEIKGRTKYNMCMS